METASQASAARVRKRHDPQSIESILKLVQVDHLPVAQVAQQAGISPKRIYRWLQAHELRRGELFLASLMRAGYVHVDPLLGFPRPLVVTATIAISASRPACGIAALAEAPLRLSVTRLCGRYQLVICHEAPRKSVPAYRPTGVGE